MQTILGDMPITQVQAKQMADKAKYYMSKEGHLRIIPDTDDETKKLRDLFNLRRTKYSPSKTTILKHVFETEILNQLLGFYKNAKEAVQVYIDESGLYQNARQNAIQSLSFQGDSSSLDL